MMKNLPVKTLIDAFPDWLSGEGIFSEMEDLPWEDEVSADLLDMDYFGNHSGWKKCSPLVYKLFDDDYALSDADREKLAALVTSKFLPNWIALWNTYHFDYDPLNDYDITEEGEREGTFQKSRAAEKTTTKEEENSTSITHGHVVSEAGSSGLDETTELTHGEKINDEATISTEEDITFTHGEKIESEGENSGTEVVSRWGFNSTTDPVPADKREVSSENSDTTTHSGDDVTDRNVEVSEERETTHSGKDTTTVERDVEDARTTTNSGTDRGLVSLEGTQSEVEGSADAGYDTDEYTKRKQGLRGIYARQELIMKERELWKDSFFDKVYSDVDSVLASMIYQREHRVSPYSLFPFGYYSI